jgi:hypothetical protein
MTHAKLTAILLAFAAMMFGEAAAQNYSLNPTYGTNNIVARSTPIEATQDLQSGGNINAASLGSPCVGYIANAPDYRVNYSPGMHSLTFSVTSSYDTTLVINGPDGRWYCDDDGGVGNNPMIRFDSPTGGQYDIWVGTYGEARLRPAQLRVTESLNQQAARREREQRNAAARVEAQQQRAEAERLRREAEQRQQEEERRRLEAQREARRVSLTSRFGAETAALIQAGEVRIGMSGEAVREALGAPQRVERVAPGEEMWTYSNLRVVLLNNRVTFIRR